MTQSVGPLVPDQHWHQHATCFHFGDRGLVVITSCGHRGISDTVRQAHEFTGVEKIHALWAASAISASARR